MIKPVSVFSMLSCFAMLSALVAVGCATEPDDVPEEGATAVATSDLRIGGFNAEGDACTVRTKPDGTNVPGTEKGLECCSTADPKDCVVILKPFPTAFLRQ